MSATEVLSSLQFKRHPVRAAAQRVHAAEKHAAGRLGHGVDRALDALEGPHDPGNWNDHPDDIGEITP